LRREDAQQHLHAMCSCSNHEKRPANTLHSLSCRSNPSSVMLGAPSGRC
jgi:hypothetical protein